MGLLLVPPPLASASERCKEPVRPILECVVEKGARDFTAYFGYDNENPTEVTIKVGSHNKFTPNPIDRGQPRVFKPGRTHAYPEAAFSVRFDGKKLEWTLAGPDGKRRTATASGNSKRCKGSPADTTPPVVTAPPSTTVAATGLGGTPATDPQIQQFLTAATAIDNVDGPITPTHNAPVVFPLGATTVTFTATDKAGNKGTAASTLTVADRTPPNVTAPPPATVDAVDSAGTPATHPAVQQFLAAATATDNVDGPITPTHNAPAVFPAGPTTVTFAATDKAGNKGVATGTLTVVDRTAPVVTAPPNGRVQATSGSGIAATAPTVQAFLAGATATDNVNGSLPVSNDLPPTVPVGTITVTFTAKDEAGNSASATSTLTVDPPAGGDTTPPTISAVIEPPPTAFGWNKTDVTVRFQCEDEVGGSGLERCSPPIPLANEGAGQEVTGETRDKAGNAATVKAVVNIDKTAPTVSYSLTPAPNAAGWSRGTTKVKFEGTDALSGVALETPETEVKEGEVDDPLKGGAVDRAGNVASIEVRVKIDSTSPVVRIDTPVSDSLVAADQAVVAGTASDTGSGLAAVRLNGTEVTVNADAFSGIASLVDGRNALVVAAIDAAGNEGLASTDVLRDLSPRVGFTTPANAAVVDSPTVDVSGTVSPGAKAVTVNGTPASLQGDLFSLASVSLASGPNVLTAIATDAQGRLGTARILVTRGGTGAGFVRGEAFDDTRGLPLPGVDALLLEEAGESRSTPLTQTADGRGQFVLGAGKGKALVRIRKDGFTSVDRRAEVPSQTAYRLLDARLTPLDSRTNPITSAAGGEARSADGQTRLVLPAGAVAQNVPFRLTAISGQGLRTPLPFGWSPAGAAEVQPLGLHLQQPSTLKLANTFGLPPGRQLLAARYDETRHAWVAAGHATVTPIGDGVEVPIEETGQWVVAAADSGANPPPEPQPGSDLQGVAEQPLGSDAIATGTTTPSSAPAGPDVRSTGSVSVTPGQPSPSGTRVVGQVGERFDLRSGASVVPQPFAQDLLAYADPRNGDTGQLSASFPITPSKAFTPLELSTGRVLIDVAPAPPPTGGTVVGSEGGVVVDGAGGEIEIAAGSLSEGTVVDLLSLSPGQLSAPVPPGFVTLAIQRLDLTGSVLSAQPTLSIVRPAFVTDASQVLIGQAYSDPSGESRIRIVAIGQIDEARVVARSEVGARTLPGITRGGDYVFLLASQPLGFVDGIVKASNGVTPQDLASVTADSAPFADLTDASGRYFVGARVGVDTKVAANDLAGNSSSGTTNLPAVNALASMDLTLGVAAPTVVSTTPARDATRVPLDTTLLARFSESLDPASVVPAAVVLKRGADAVAGAAFLSVDGRSLTFRPDAPLGSNTAYTFELTSLLKDPAGNALATYAPVAFTTLDTSGPPTLPAGRLTAELPDEDGLVMVFGTPGTAEANSNVTATNQRTRETVSVLADDQGSFRIRIAARLVDPLAVTLRTDGASTTVLISQYESPDGRTAVGDAGGTVTGASNRRVFVLPRALSTAGILRLQDRPADQPLPVLPGGFSFADSFSLELEGAAFRSLATLTLTESQGRFPAASATYGPFEESASFFVPADFLVNGSLRFAAVAEDANGGRNRTDASTLVVGGSPDVTRVEAAFADRFPTVYLAAPRQALVSQQIEVTAEAPVSRLGVEVPKPGSLGSPGSLFLTRVIDIAGTPRLALADEVAGARSGAQDVLRTLGRRMGGAREPGTYAVVASEEPLVLVTGRSTGPAAIVEAAGLPFVYETDGANGAFAIPVPAGQSFEIHFTNRATGASLGQATGVAPASGTVNLGTPLSPPNRTLRATAEPDERYVVDIDRPVVFTFSEPVDPQTLNASTVVVTDAAGSRIDGRIAVSDDGLKATFTPKRRWRFGTGYRYGLSSEVRGVSGAALAQAFAGSFKTFAQQVIATQADIHGRTVAAWKQFMAIGGDGGLTIFDASQPDSPRRLASVSVSQGVNRVRVLPDAALSDRDGRPVTGTLLLATAGSTSTEGSILIVDVNVPESPRVIGRELLTVPAGHPAPTPAVVSGGVPIGLDVTSEGRCFVSVPGHGILAVELSRTVPASANGSAIVGRIDQQGDASPGDVRVLRDRVLSTSAAGVQAFDTATLQAAGDALVVDSATTVEVISNQLYDLDGDGVRTPSETVDIAIIGTRDGSILYADVSGGRNPSLLGVVPVDSEVVSLTFEPGRGVVYATLETGTVLTIDGEDVLSLQPLDSNADGSDDRLLGRIAASRAPAVESDLLGLGTGAIIGSDGLVVAHLSPPRSMIRDVERDPIVASTGDEESILAQRKAFTSDQGFRLTFDVVAPPRGPLTLAIEGYQGLTFDNGGSALALHDGLNVVALRNLAANNNPLPASFGLRLTDLAGLLLTRFDVSLEDPVPLLTSIESIYAAPADITLTPTLPSAELSVGALLASGRTLNVTGSTNGSTYVSDDAMIATVEAQGTVAAQAGGNTTVTVRNRAMTTTAGVQSTLPPFVRGLEMSPSYTTITRLDERPVLAVWALLSDDSRHDVTVDGATSFDVSDPAVLRVAGGRITPVGGGHTSVTATYAGQTAQAFAMVMERTVPDLTAIKIEADEAAPKVGQNLTVRAAVEGVGSLDGLQVTIRADGRSLIGVASARTDTTGSVAAIVGRPESVGMVTLTAAVVDPTDGQVLTAVANVPIEDPTGDVEPNDDPSAAGPLAGFETAQGGLGPTDVVDWRRIEIFEAGRLIIQVTSPASEAAPLDVIVRLEGGSEFYRQRAVTPSSSFDIRTTPGTYFLGVTAPTPPQSIVEYTIAYSTLQDPVVIDAVVPSAGPPGTEVLVRGSGFSTRSDRMTLFLGGSLAEVVAASPTEFRTIVPVNAFDGPIVVTVATEKADGPSFRVGRPFVDLGGVVPLDPERMAADPESKSLFATDRLLVRFSPMADRATVEDAIRPLGGTVLGFLPLDNTYQIGLSSRDLYQLEGVRRSLAANPSVRSAERVGIITFEGAPADFEPGIHSAPGKPGACGRTPGCRWAADNIRATEAYRYLESYSAGAIPLSTVTLAVLDSGLLDETEFANTSSEFYQIHPFFPGTALFRGPAYFDNVQGIPHGTLVARTIAAERNGEYSSGILASVVDPDRIKLVILGIKDLRPKLPVVFGHLVASTDEATKALQGLTSCAYSADTCPTTGLHDALEKTQVMNLSFGNNNNGAGRKAFFDLFWAMRKTLFVVAAGNNNCDIKGEASCLKGKKQQWPALLASDKNVGERVIAVAAVAASTERLPLNSSVSNGEPDERANFNTPGERSNYGERLLSAPGLAHVNISSGPGTFASGTSFAAPHVTAAAGLLLATRSLWINANASPLRTCTGGALSPTANLAKCLKQHLLDTADAIGTSPGWGGAAADMKRLNLLSALVRALPPPTDTSVVIADAGGGAGGALGLLHTFPINPLDPFGDLAPQVKRGAKEIGGGCVSSRGASSECERLNPSGSMVFSPDGLTLYASNGNGPWGSGAYLARISTVNWKLQQLHLIGSGFDADLAMRADGKYIYFTDNTKGSSRIGLFDTRSQQQVDKVPIFDPALPKPVTMKSVQPLQTSATSLSHTTFVRLFTPPSGESVLFAGAADFGETGKKGGLFAIATDPIGDDADRHTTGRQGPNLCLLEGSTCRIQIDGVATTSGLRPTGIAVRRDSPLSLGVLVVHGDRLRLIDRQTYSSGLLAETLLEEFALPAQPQGFVFVAPGWVDALSVPNSGFASSGLGRPADGLPGRFLTKPSLAWTAASADNTPEGPMFGQRPFGVAMRPDGKRAIAPFFFGGNFAIFDLETQPEFTPARADDRFVAVAARTPALDLDVWGWPKRRGFLIDLGPSVDSERQLYPSAVGYAQTGRLALAAHAGTSITYGSDRTGHQLGAISLIDDQAISTTLEKQRQIPKGEKGYLGTSPLDSDEAVQPIFKIAGRELEKPTGATITPTLAFFTPLTGDVLWRTAPVMLWWRLPYEGPNVIAFERVQIEVKDLTNGEPGVLVSARDYPAGRCPGVAMTCNNPAPNALQVPFSELVTNPWVNGHCPSGDRRMLRLTARLIKGDITAESVVRASFTCGG